MHRLATSIALLLLTLPLCVSAQEVRLRGMFSLVRAPAADTRPPTGEARAVVDEDGRVRVDLVVAGLTERATSATLHTGDAGENTEQVARLDVAADDGEARVIGGRVDLTPLVAQQVRAGSAYIVLRTSEHPDGFLRAQLAPQARTLGSVSNGP
ncbi:CHRD domain-containing protein [Cognatilysobacter segetis]|uniref:CHRD domain-containing protein n=1 Tax=Cognatilysobacter segetis TaxID=2492394 RepID=UPI00105D3B58|nr:CHRD domain-containing protein [Lysobacter segetis]